MIKYTDDKTIKNIITGEEMDAGETKCNLKELIIKRQEEIKEKINLSEKYLKANNDLEWLLRKIDNVEVSKKIRDIIDDRDCTLGYTHYIQGLFDGIKEALILRKKNLNTSI